MHCTYFYFDFFYDTCVKYFINSLKVKDKTNGIAAFCEHFFVLQLNETTIFVTNSLIAF